MLTDLHCKVIRVLPRKILKPGAHWHSTCYVYIQGRIEECSIGRRWGGGGWLEARTFPQETLEVNLENFQKMTPISCYLGHSEIFFCDNLSSYFSRKLWKSFREVFDMKIQI